MKQIFSLLAIASLLLFACNKEEDHSRDVTRENLIGTYQYTAATYQVGNNTPTDEFALLEACEKDDMLQLNANQTYNFIDAGTQCTPPGNDNGTWALVSTSKFQFGLYTFDVKSFDGKALALSGNDTSNNVISTYTITFVKQ